jgi:membrane protein DedA with SNARE-associated domain
LARIAGGDTIVDTLSEFLIEFIRSENSLAGLAIIAASAMIEYLVPPFPGDTLTLFAAVLITGHGWSFFAVFGSVMAGSLAGSMATFYLGGWLRRRRAREPAPEKDTMVVRLVVKFQRHGSAYLVLNRFLPGVRALFFVAAGMAGMRPAAVLFYSALSAALWNLAVIAAGSAVGANFDTLLGWVRRYTTIMWVIISAIVLLWTARYVMRRRSE